MQQQIVEHLALCLVQSLEQIAIEGAPLRTDPPGHVGACLGQGYPLLRLAAGIGTLDREPARFQAARRAAHFGRVDLRLVGKLRDGRGPEPVEIGHHAPLSE